MSRLAKEISVTGAATFAFLLVVLVIGQLLGAAFSADPQPVRVLSRVLESEGAQTQAVEAVDHTAKATDVAANDTVKSDATEDTGAVTTAAAAAADQGAAVATGKIYGLGRKATRAEIAAWDIDVRPDGQGLPEGSGDVFTGEEVFADNCAVCHGDFGEAVGRWPVLAGGQDTLASENPVKTIGSYWPYLSTVFDYVNRAMPFGNAQSLSADEVYAITAYLLYVNDLVDEDFELSHENFTEIALPNEPNFFPDDRAETEYTKFVSAGACMTDCKETVEVTGRARVVDVTPEETKARHLREAVNAVTAPVITDDEDDAGDTTEVAAADTATTGQTPTETPAETPAAAADPALIADGEKAFKKCKACHEIGEGAKKKSGPILTDVVGRTIGAMDGFNYSSALRSAGEEGRVWSADELRAFLADPKGYLKGTKMSFRGFKKDSELDAIIAYLAANGG